jgi:hypothetical protein
VHRPGVKGSDDLRSGHRRSRQALSSARMPSSLYPQGCSFSRAKGWEVEVVFRGHRMLGTFKEGERVNQVAKNAIEALMTESSDLRASAVSLRAEETENKRQRIGGFGWVEHLLKSTWGPRRISSKFEPFEYECHKALLGMLPSLPRSAPTFSLM